MAGRKMKAKEKKIEKREVPEYKTKIVSDLVNKIKQSRTFLIASTRGLPSSQFHEIKKNLRGKASIKVAKKSAILRAIDSLAKASLDKIKENIGADIALFFSDIDPFTLSALLADNKSSAKAKAGDIAPEDINVEPGPTNLVPGPAISELSSVGLKVAVEGGKLAIKLPHTIVKAGETIKENVASVLAKLDIKPMKVGFEPIAAYDKEDDKVYVGIKIDKKKTYEELKEMIRKALGFAVSRGYLTKETISFFITKAGREEIALINLINSKTTSQSPQTESAGQPAASS
ncbi:MAG: 50S ribosomal protein L10 [Candidatus Pacearchaeota archaeon]